MSSVAVSLKRDASNRHGFFRPHVNPPLCMHGLSQRLILMCIKMVSVVTVLEGTFYMLFA